MAEIDRLSLKTVAEALYDGLVVTDSLDRIVFFNPAAERIFGYSREEVIGKSLTMLIPDSVSEKHERGLQRYLTTGISDIIGKVVRCEGVRKGGAVFPMELTVSAFQTKAPSTSSGSTFFLGVVRDITAMVELERYRRREARLGAIECLATGAAHEILNPLNIISMELQILKKERAADDELAMDIERTLLQVHRIQNVCDNLARFARPEKAPKNKLPLSEIVVKVIAQQKEAIEKSNITLVKEFAQEDLYLFANKSQIEFAVSSVVSNAIDSMQNGGKLTIRTSAKTVHGKEYASITISDTGPGIAPENIDKIFNPFFTTKEPGMSLGLNLSAALGIVEDHGGKIEVQSTPGKGAQFTILLPLSHRSH